MSRPAKVQGTELDEEHKMPAVSTPTKLSGKYIGGTSGSDYNASIKEAYDWAFRRDNDKNYPYYTILIDYYPQLVGKKSILFSFNLVAKPEKDLNVKP